VVSLVAFESENKTQLNSIKTVMKDAISKDAALEDSKIRVDDSKLVYRGSTGLAQLEKTVLSFWFAAQGKLPRNLGEWLDENCLQIPPDLEECPWYGSQARALPLPHILSEEKIVESGSLVRNTLQDQGIKAIHVGQQILTEPIFNRGITQFDNKSELLNQAVGSLIQEASAHTQASGTCEIDVDKLGGRTYYRNMLHTIYPLQSLDVLEEAPACSAYSVKAGEQGIRIRFHRKGDRLFFRIALASMFSKYTRELFMALFNRFWIARAPSLRPTAGYPLDARRFLEDVKPAAHAEGIDPQAFTRIR
jgi:hypothetical protein